MNLVCAECLRNLKARVSTFWVNVLFVCFHPLKVVWSAAAVPHEFQHWMTPRKFPGSVSGRWSLMIPVCSVSPVFRSSFGPCTVDFPLGLRRSLPSGPAGRCWQHEKVVEECVDVSKIMVPPNYPFVHRVFHYFHYPFWGVYHYFWKHPH